MDQKKYILRLKSDSGIESAHRVVVRKSKAGKARLAQGKPKGRKPLVNGVQSKIRKANGR